MGPRSSQLLQGSLQGPRRWWWWYGISVDAALLEHLLARLLDAVPLHLLSLVLGRRREANHVDGEADEAEERQASSDAQHKEPAIPVYQDHEECDDLAEEGEAQQREAQPRHEGDRAGRPPREILGDIGRCRGDIGEI